MKMNHDGSRGAVAVKGKQVVVGVTGGIAAYKAAEVVRLLVRAEVQVRVAMTRNATRFVGPVTFEALSGQRVLWDMWAQQGTALEHIQWGQCSDLIIIAPATANFIGKMARGIADDFLSTMVLAATAKILVCPAMNTHMYRHPAVQENLRLLASRGVRVMSPAEGSLACRTEGPGRLPEPAEILEAARGLLVEQDLEGLRILVTAGPTEEPLDPVRHLSNRSSGKMGYAVARAASRRGARVTLISGPTALAPPAGVVLRRVRTAEQMREAVLEAVEEHDIVVKAAAVSDYRPEQAREHKIKKGGDTLTVRLRKNPDILAELGARKREGRPLLVGFAAETEDLLEHAWDKLRAKQADMIVANDVSRADAGFAVDTNRVKLLTADGRQEDLPTMPKDEVAERLLDRIRDCWKERCEGGS